MVNDTLIAKTDWVMSVAFWFGLEFQGFGEILKTKIQLSIPLMVVLVVETAFLRKRLLSTSLFSN